MRGILQLMLSVSLLLSSAERVESGEIEVRAGIGYDYLSQRFFLDSAAIEGPDSALVDWQLRTTYLDDLKGILSVSYTPLKSNELKLRAAYDQTADFLRLRAGSDFSREVGKTRVDLYSDVEWRDRNGAGTDFGDSYIYLYGRSKLTTPLTSSLSMKIQLQAEDVDFKSVTSTGFAYSRLTGYLGLSKSFADFSFGDLRLFAGTRNVSDSSQLDYSSIGAEVNFFGSLVVGNLDFALRLEHKDYNRPGNQADHQNLDSYCRNSTGVGSGWVNRQEFEFEAALYPDEDPVNSSYLRTGLAVLTGVDKIGYTVTLGPELELLDEEAPEFGDGEDYFETGIRADFDYLQAASVFGSLELSLGHRNLRFENELQTDFYYHRLTGTADIRVWSVLNLSLLVSTEWEWHDERENNSELFLISSSLTYSF